MITDVCSLGQIQQNASKHYRKMLGTELHTIGLYFLNLYNEKLKKKPITNLPGILVLLDTQQPPTSYSDLLRTKDPKS
jgi:hypothetical protein